MPSLYIHIPFCSKKCHYCNFSVLTDLSLKENYLNKLNKDISYWLGEIPQNTITTIYLGGGTPSLLSAKEVHHVLQLIFKHTSRKHIQEVTIELNPENVNKEYILTLCHAGITRFSMGVQSLDDTKLRQAGRAHNSKQCIEAMSILHKLHTNWSCDLIVGLPYVYPPKSRHPELNSGSTCDTTNKINEILQYSPKHISIYDLSIEKDTPFALLPPETFPQENISLQQRNDIDNILKENGFIDYEISNYALPGYESKHNMVYWTGDEYIGIGLGASSYYQGKLWSNYKNMNLWLDSKHGYDTKQVNSLSLEERGDLFFMGRTRLWKPIYHEELAPFYPNTWDKKKDILRQLAQQELIELCENSIQMTTLGRRFHNTLLNYFYEL